MSNQDIDGHILKMKAQFFANNLHIDDFNQSDGWLTGFKNGMDFDNLKSKMNQQVLLLLNH